MGALVRKPSPQLQSNPYPDLNIAGVQTLTLTTTPTATAPLLHAGRRCVPRLQHRWRDAVQVSNKVDAHQLLRVYEGAEVRGLGFTQSRTSCAHLRQRSHGRQASPTCLNPLPMPHAHAPRPRPHTWACPHTCPHHRPCTFAGRSCTCPWSEGSCSRPPCLLPLPPALAHAPCLLPLPPPLASCPCLLPKP